ncbi:hypothetical protein BS47DRAFT_1336368 [Hydnum rufescens UP504]|uniref:Uncharacterized protein n=1 Tax=Hydnum rufescens UP504 TaxID=1448309 RepID=A0A9P6BAR3_9AGAM|nr:hypothetical protein BS47DRAFT_1336368 [Hydnum rufescens UP504]
MDIAQGLAVEIRRFSEFLSPINVQVSLVRMTMPFECSFTISPPKKPAFEDKKAVSSRPLLIDIFLIRVSSSRSGGTIPDDPIPATDSFEKVVLLAALTTV